MVKKKICIFITRMISGGAQKVVLQLLRSLPKESYELSLLTSQPDKGEPDLLGELPDGIKLHLLPELTRELHAVQDANAFFHLKKFLQRERFDLLHLHTSKAGVLGAFAGRAARVPRIIYTPHGHIFDRRAGIPGVQELPGWKRHLLYRIRQAAYSCCDTLVALSDADKAEQVALRLARPEKFHVIMNGIEVEHFSLRNAESAKNFRREQNIPEDAPLLGSLGRLSFEKGHDILLRAFAKLCKTAGNAKNAMLVIGGSGAEMNILQSLARELGIAGHVRFAGNLTDVRPCLWALDVFVLPSRYESQGLAAMEAMASALPVIASKTGGVPGIIESGKDGLLVPPENPDALASAIGDLLGDTRKRSQLASAALSRAMRDFTLSRMLSSYQELYEVDT